MICLQNYLCVPTQFGRRMTTGNGIIGLMGRTGQCSLFPISCWKPMAELGTPLITLVRLPPHLSRLMKYTHYFYLR